MSAMIGLFSATHLEVAPLRKRLTLTESSRQDGCVIEPGRHGELEVLLVQFGMGKQRAETAAKAILPRYPLSAVISLGFAGALTDRLEPGDVVLCSAVRHAQDKTIESDSRLLFEAAMALEGLNVANAVGVSSQVFVSTPEAKRALAVTSGAAMVDMESYWIGKEASEAGVPFLSVRAISDTLTARLPPIGRFIDENGEIRLQSVASHCLTRPRDLIRLLSFRRAAGRAASRLTYAIDNVLRHISNNEVPEMAEQASIRAPSDLS
jgi:adenosylhomocysteine nucleosidase